jgi:DNA-binding PadR family transcriptional regulator
MRHCRHQDPERGSDHPEGFRRGRFMRGRHMHGRHRHLGGRVFEQGDLRYVILKLIADKPAHGYELIKEIEERLGGAYSPSPGVIYPTLTLLEELGYVAIAPGEGVKKAYAITPEGVEHLEQNKAAVEAIFERIATVAERTGSRRSPQIVRAMENLMLALKLKLERGRLTEQQITAVAQALDAAAQAIEKD